MKKYINSISVLAISFVLLSANSSEAFFCCGADSIQEERENIHAASIVLPERWDGDIYRFAGKMIGDPRRGELLDADITLSRYNGGVDARSQGPSCDTRLTFATALGDVELVRMLLDRRANADAKTADTGETALMIAIKSSRYDIANMLLDREVGLHVRDARNRTALVIAVTRSADIALVRRLILDGSDSSLVLPGSPFVRDVKISRQMKEAIDQARQERQAIVEGEDAGLRLAQAQEEAVGQYSDSGDADDEKSEAESNGDHVVGGYVLAPLCQSSRDIALDLDTLPTLTDI